MALQGDSKALPPLAPPPPAPDAAGAPSELQAEDMRLAAAAVALLPSCCWPAAGFRDDGRSRETLLG